MDMIAKDGSTCTKIVNFMTLGAGVLVLGRSHKVKTHSFLYKFSSLPPGIDKTIYMSVHWTSFVEVIIYLPLLKEMILLKTIVQRTGNLKRPKVSS